MLLSEQVSQIAAETVLPNKFELGTEMQRPQNEVTILDFASEVQAQAEAIPDLSDLLLQSNVIARASSNDSALSILDQLEVTHITITGDNEFLVHCNDGRLLSARLKPTNSTANTDNKRMIPMMFNTNSRSSTTGPELVKFVITDEDLATRLQLILDKLEPLRGSFLDENAVKMYGDIQPGAEARIRLYGKYIGLINATI